MKNPKNQSVTGACQVCLHQHYLHFYDTVKLLAQCILYESDSVSSLITGTHFLLLFWLNSPVSCASDEMVHLKVPTFSFECVLACSHLYWVSRGKTCIPWFLPLGVYIKRPLQASSNDDSWQSALYSKCNFFPVQWAAVQSKNKSVFMFSNFTTRSHSHYNNLSMCPVQFFNLPCQYCHDCNWHWGLFKHFLSTYLKETYCAFLFGVLYVCVLVRIKVLES